MIVQVNELELVVGFEEAALSWGTEALSDYTGITKNCASLRTGSTWVGQFDFYLVGVWVLVDHLNVKDGWSVRRARILV
jgi:hypothetical protein